MNKDSLHFSLTDKLHPEDTEEQTYGCRANNPDICKNCFVSGICAFSSDDKICKSPSSKWKKYYRSLQEDEIRKRSLKND